MVVLGGLVLFFALAMLALRRRNEMLQDFLTPEEPNLEQEFFGARTPKQKEALPEEKASEPETTETETTGTDDVDAEHVRWGTAEETASPSPNSNPTPDS